MDNIMGTLVEIVDDLSEADSVVREAIEDLGDLDDKISRVFDIIDEYEPEYGEEPLMAALRQLDGLRDKVADMKQELERCSEILTG